MRVCLVTGSQPVDYTRFLDREALSLARAGHDVHLIGLETSRDPERRPGVTLHRLPSRTGAAKRRTVGDIKGAVTGLEPDVCHCCDPWSLAAGLSLKRRSAVRRLVYDATEDFPAVYAARHDLGRPLAVLANRVVEHLERRACNEADELIETNATRAKRFERRGRTVELVGNFPPIAALPEPGSLRLPLFAYTGPITRHRGFLQLLDALAMVRSRFPEAGLRVVGDYDPRDNIEPLVRKKLDDDALGDAVIFLGRLGYAAMFGAVADCIAGVILLQRSRANDYSGQPNKLFEFMGSGLAVLASDFPEIGPVLRRESCGLTVDASEPESIAAAMMALLADPGAASGMGMRGRAAVLQRYNWTVAERVLLRVYERLAC